MIKTKIKVAIFLSFFVLMIGLMISGWSHSISFAEEVISAPSDSATTSTSENTDSTPSDSVTTLTPITTSNTTSDSTGDSVSNSDFTPITPSPPSQAEESVSQIEESQEEEFVNELASQPEQESESLLSPQTLIKERKFERLVHFDKNPQHACIAKNFNVDLSGKNQAIVELEFTGMRSDSENLEIGSLPLGIDITFLNNADYSWSPLKSDGGAVLQIVNQPGSQKGNFSIPIIYTSGNSTTVCQINVINL